MKHILIFALLLLVGCGKDGATGSAGPQGLQGPQGPAGTNGTNGSDNKVVASIFCQGEITGLSGAAGTALNGLWVDYNAVLTGAGDVFARAAVIAPSLQIGDTEFYSANQAGALTASVIFVADFATSNSGWWNISLNRSTLVVTAVYTDSSLGGQSPVTITFTPSACSAQSY